MRLPVPFLPALLLAAAGCANNHVTAKTPGPVPPAADADRTALLATDRAFSARSVEKGSDVAFLEYVGEGATFLPMGGAPVVGTRAIVDAFGTPSPGTPGKTELRWDPVAADASGDLGYTWGTFVSVREAADGARVERHGKYTTIWRRQTDGKWKWVLDIGNLGPG